ncbi:MAG: GTPase (G3E family) [Lachnospiraceae bacterium]|nr:GTPase (G3E family) [Lachnospiraceae bacterium]MDO4409623.1 GTP-binding protein [Eubacteriales bacterium]
MPQIDLITGFLGAGKTTFIKKYVKFLVDQGAMVGILESDYGAINIDLAFLQDLMGDNCDVEMVTGGDGILSHRRRFQTKLISMAMTGYDIVVVEPSGIYDTDEFFDAMAEEPICDWYSPGCMIAIVDADLGELSEESEYLLVSQTDNAGKILLSHLEKGIPEEEKRQKVSNVLDRVNRALERFKSSRRFTEEDIVAVCWDELTVGDMETIGLCGMIPANHVKLPVERESGYGSLFYYGTKMTEEELRARVKETFSNPECGNVIRVKGFVRTSPDTLMQINATAKEMQIEPTVFAREVLIVTGEDLHREAIDGIWAEASEIITPGNSTAGL